MSETYTHDQVAAAVNAGAELLGEEAEIGEDLVNLIVNTIMSVLDNPEATITDVAEDNYGESAETVLGWL